MSQAVLPQIKKLIERFQELEGEAKGTDWSYIDIGTASEFVMSGIAAIQRATGQDSAYSTELENAAEKLADPWIQARIPYVGGALRAVLHAIESGYLVTVEELIHADVFGDFLEMAHYLLDEGYKDPAAVLIGGVLEGHLRKLCVKSGIATELTEENGKPRPKKAERMNTDLAGKQVYSKLDQKSVTAWLDLRNKAAHGHYAEYSQEQVALMSQGVTDFLTRKRA
jgi:hypothetical protein